MKNYKVTILTPSVADPMRSGRWREIYAQIKCALEGIDIYTFSQPWDDQVALESSNSDLILPLLAWGYQRDHQRWLLACETWEKQSLPVLNPPDVLIWNTDKRYLEELREQGAPVVASLYCDEPSPLVLARACEQFDTDALVIKPTISATAYRTSLWRGGGDIVDPPVGGCIIQPFYETIAQEGEISLVYHFGQLSHALRKYPAPGDFRVQPEWGGHIVRYIPDSKAIRAAENVLMTLGTELLYARIDMIRSDFDEWHLLEAELIEPDLYLGMDASSGGNFAAAVRDRITRFEK